MRAPADPAKVRRFLEGLGRASRGPGRVYLTGGATALLEGWRGSTVDIDLKLDPEPEGAFEAIARLKDELDVNVELASPDLFLPPVPGWRERSPWVSTHGPVEVHHFDFVSQALAKLSRGHDRDLDDVRAMLERGYVTADALRDGLRAIEPDLIRYPALDADVLRAAVEAFLREPS